MIDGILIINKEKGFTSFDVVAKLRGILHQKKIGHTGTLDPDATGVLVVLLGNATKLSEMLMSDTKRYTVGMKLGFTSDTDDTSGDVKEAENEYLLSMDESERDDEIRRVIDSFTGTYMQIPPMYAAIKVDGKKLYEYAREGVYVERTPREVTIYELNNTRIDYPDVSFDIYCSKGTYVRSLCRDIGEALHTGGVMSSLRRDVTGDFTLKDSYTLSEVQQRADDGTVESIVIPMDRILSEYSAGDIKEEYKKLLQNGNKLPLDSYETREKGTDNKYIRLYMDGSFKALYMKQGDSLKPYKMF